MLVLFVSTMFNFISLRYIPFTKYIRLTFFPRFLSPFIRVHTVYIEQKVTNYTFSYFRFHLFRVYVLSIKVQYSQKKSFVWQLIISNLFWKYWIFNDEILTRRRWIRIHENVVRVFLLYTDEPKKYSKHHHSKNVTNHSFPIVYEFSIKVFVSCCTLLAWHCYLYSLPYTFPFSLGSSHSTTSKQPLLQTNFDV